MRALIILSLLVLLATGGAVLGFTEGARGEEPPSPEQLALMKKRQEVLELQVAYLLEREEDLSAYVTANLERGREMAQALRRARAEGFTQAAISSTSRELLLTGLEAQARAMQEGVPAVTKEQERLLREIDRRKRAP